MGRPEEGECKLHLCTRPAIGKKRSLYRGLCEFHWENGYGHKLPKGHKGKDPRGFCAIRGCKSPNVWPYSEGLCKHHNPKAQELTVLERQVIEAVAEGADPVRTVMVKSSDNTRGELGMQKAERKLERMVKDKPAFRAEIDIALVKAGITTDRVFDKLADALEARKQGMTKDGEVVDMGPDTTNALRAIDTWAKITGAYAPKQIEQDIEKRELNVVIGLPEQTALPPNTPVYTIPAPKNDKGK